MLSVSLSVDAVERRLKGDSTRSLVAGERTDDGDAMIVPERPLVNGGVNTRPHALIGVAEDVAVVPV